MPTWEQIEAATRVLSDQLGVAGEWVWPILVKQQVIIGLQWLFMVLVLLAIAGGFGFPIARYCNRKHRERIDGGKRSDWDDLAVFSVIFAGILAFLATWLLAVAVPYLFNPEYYAIMDLLRAIPGN